MKIEPTRRRFGALLGTIPLLWLTGARTALARQTDHQVSIRKFVFKPAELVITVGDRVTWTNLDIAPHTATEFSEGLWDTGELSRNDTNTIVFNEPGSFTYYCVFHPHMKGVIQVNE